MMKGKMQRGTQPLSLIIITSTAPMLQVLVFRGIGGRAIPRHKGGSLCPTNLLTLFRTISRGSCSNRRHPLSRDIMHSSFLLTTIMARQWMRSLATTQIILEASLKMHLRKLGISSKRWLRAAKGVISQEVLSTLCTRHQALSSISSSSLLATAIERVFNLASLRELIQRSREHRLHSLSWRTIRRFTYRRRYQARTTSRRREEVASLSSSSSIRGILHGGLNLLSSMQKITRHTMMKELTLRKRKKMTRTKKMNTVTR